MQSQVPDKEDCHCYSKYLLKYDIQSCLTFRSKHHKSYLHKSRKNNNITLNHIVQYPTFATKNIRMVLAAVQSFYLSSYFRSQGWNTKTEQLCRQYIDNKTSMPENETSCCVQQHHYHYYMKQQQYLDTFIGYCGISVWHPVLLMNFQSQINSTVDVYIIVIVASPLCLRTWVLPPSC